VILNTAANRTAMQAVLDAPDAEAPRLAYAVLCEANGESKRGQFIRLQIETARRARAGRDDWWEPASQARELHETTSDAWAGPIHKRVTWYDFYGGFVEDIQLDAKDFLGQADELYQLAPIRRLALQNVAPVVEELFHSPHLARIVSLSLAHQKLGDRGIELLAASPYLGKLVSLDLPGNEITLESEPSRQPGVHRERDRCGRWNGWSNHVPCWLRGGMEARATLRPQDMASYRRGSRPA
jgi:uncharacterized protein (TIGR02996 family)